MLSTKPNSRDYLFLRYLENFREVQLDHLNNFKAKSTRISLFVLALVCNIDVCAKFKGLRVEREPSKWWRPQLFGLFKPIKYSDWWLRQRYTWTADAILMIYWLLNVYLMFNIYYQYLLDFDKLRLMRLEAMAREGLVSEAEFDQRAANMLHRIDDTTNTLRAIGAPHRHLGIAIECLYLYILLFAFILYYMGHIFFRFCTPFDFHFVRELIDLEEEQRYTDLLIKEQVIRFLESDKAFAKVHHGASLVSLASLASLTFYNQEADKTNYQSPRRRSTLLKRPNGSRSSLQWSSLESRKDEPSRWKNLISLTQDQQETRDILTRMYQSGALRPYNKSLELFKIRNNILFIGIPLLIIFIAIFFSALMAYLLSPRDTNVTHSWPDLAIMVSLLIVISTIASTGALLGILFLACTLDQVAMVGKVRDLILACIGENNHEFHRLNATKELYSSIQKDTREKNYLEKSVQTKIIMDLETSSKLSVHKMNTNFLFIFFQYKIFLAQYYPPRQATQAVVVKATTLLLLIFLVVKLHMPYLSMSPLFSNMKWFAAAATPCTIMSVNFVLLPICHLNSRFISLCRTLSSLVAHITYVESHQNGNGIYNRHAVSLLLKDTRNSHQIKHGSWIKVAGMEGTYTTLLKVHFWLGIIALSIVTDDQDYSNISLVHSSFFSDPFGVFYNSKLPQAR